jgi:hypothetical protein
MPARELAEAIRALTYGLALDRLVDDGDASDALLGRVLELLFRGMRAEEHRPAGRKRK